jgi:hypothetical protein
MTHAFRCLLNGVTKMLFHLRLVAPNGDALAEVSAVAMDAPEVDDVIWHEKDPGTRFRVVAIVGLWTHIDRESGDGELLSGTYEFSRRKGAL